MNEEYKNGYRDGFLDGWNARNQPIAPKPKEKVAEPPQPPKNFQPMNWPEYTEWKAKTETAPTFNEEV
jgi:hypothetical protein